MGKIVLSVLLIAVVGVPLYYHLQEAPPVTIEFDGVAWTQVLHWDFRDGFCPDGWGWGNWTIVEGKLQGQDDNGEASVYFLPVTHGRDFILETKVRFVEGVNVSYVAGQLLIDRSIIPGASSA